jgi:hypothetical protein
MLLRSLCAGYCAINGWRLRGRQERRRKGEEERKGSRRRRRR